MIGAISAGVGVRVQVPVGGNPLKYTLPVAVAQSGCVIRPTIGGVKGFTFMNKLVVYGGGQEVAVTVKVPGVAEGEKLIVMVLVLPGGFIVHPDPPE